MRHHFYRHLLTVSLASLAAGMPASVHAQETQAAAEAAEFSIPAQPLDAALRSFSDQADADVLYPPELVANKTSRPVRGAMAPAAALSELLKGTGILVNQVSPKSFALREAKITLRGDQATVSAVSGTVVDSKSGGTLPGARVSVEGTNAETVADARGFFNIPDVPTSASRLIVEYIGQPAETIDLPDGTAARRGLIVELGRSNTDIVVFGFRSAIQKALNQQKNADNSSTVVSSDLMGGFPAETVSEALRRVSGVAFGRDDETGEGSRITVRGFSSEAINIQLNGLDLQGTGFERSIDLSGFLTDNISEITIHKSLLPSHEATGSGGLVEIETKSALDYGDFAFNFGVEGEGNLDRDFGDEYQISGTIAKKITPNFAISATAQYRKASRLNYDVALLDEVPVVYPEGITSFSQIPVDSVYPFDPETQEQLVSSVNYNRRDREEESILGSINLAWDVADHTRLRLDVQRNISKLDSSLSQATFSFFSTTVSMPIEELDGEVRSRRVLNAFRPNSSLQLSSSESQFDTISFRGDTNIDRWSFDYKLGYSRARTKGSGSAISILSNLETDIISLIDPGTIVINPDDDADATPRVVDGAFVFGANGLPVPSLTDAGVARLFDTSEYYLNNAISNQYDNPTEAYIAELKVRYSPSPNFLEYVEIGGKYDARTRQTSDNNANPLTTITNSYTRIASQSTPLADLGVDFFRENLDIIGASGQFLPFLTASTSQSIFNQLAGLVADDPSTPDYNEQRFNFSDLTLRDATVDGGSALTPTKVTEDKLAAYLEAKVVFGDFSLVAGARYEREKRTGNTLTYPLVVVGPGVFDREPTETFLSAGLYDFTDNSGTVETWTPSFLATLRPSDNIVARLGYFRSTVHPNINLLNRGTIYTANFRDGFEAITISESNPDLKPTKTDNLDFDIAYYFTDTPGLIRAGLFYKKTTNNFTNVSFSAVPGDDSILQRYLDYLAPLAESNPYLLDVPENADLLINRPTNGEGGTIWGAEFELTRRLNFLPGFLSDFGVLANATYTNGDFPTLITVRNTDGTLGPQSFDRPLRDQAEWVYNLSLDYSKNGFDGRLIYTYQSATAETFDEFNLNLISPSYATLDLRLSYSFEKTGGMWTVFLEGDDLLRGAQSPEVRSAISPEFGDGDASFYFPQSYQFNGGRNVTLGIRARF